MISNVWKTIRQWADSTTLQDTTTAPNTAGPYRWGMPSESEMVGAYEAMKHQYEWAETEEMWVERVVRQIHQVATDFVMKKMEEAVGAEARAVLGDAWPTKEVMAEVKEWLDGWKSAQKELFEMWPTLEVIVGKPMVQGDGGARGGEMPGWFSKWLPMWGIWVTERPQQQVGTMYPGSAMWDPMARGFGQYLKKAFPSTQEEIDAVYKALQPRGLGKIG